MELQIQIKYKSYVSNSRQKQKKLLRQHQNSTKLRDFYSNHIKWNFVKKIIKYYKNYEKMRF